MISVKCLHRTRIEADKHGNGNYSLKIFMTQPVPEVPLAYLEVEPEEFEKLKELFNG